MIQIYYENTFIESLKFLQDKWERLDANINKKKCDLIEEWGKLTVKDLMTLWKGNKK